MRPHLLLLPRRLCLIITTTQWYIHTKQIHAAYLLGVAGSWIYLDSVPSRIPIGYLLHQVFKREMLDIKGSMQAHGTAATQSGHADGTATSNIERFTKLLEGKDGWKMLKDTPDHSYGYCAVRKPPIICVPAVQDDLMTDAPRGSAINCVPWFSVIRLTEEKSLGNARLAWMGRQTT